MCVRSPMKHSSSFCTSQGFYLILRFTVQHSNQESFLKFVFVTWRGLISKIENRKPKPETRNPSLKEKTREADPSLGLQVGVLPARVRVYRWTRV